MKSFSRRVERNDRGEFMLTISEKLLFVLAVLVSLYAAYRAAERIFHIVGRGRGKPDWSLAMKRLVAVLVKTISFQPVFRFRFWSSLFHGLVAWGFIYYVFVNIGDVLQGFIPDYHFLGTNTTGNLYRLGADILSVAVWVGMVVLMIRRFTFKPAILTTRENILLHPKARFSIRRDSAIVGGFILIHVGSRFTGETFKIASGGPDAWQPFASIVANLWEGWRPNLLTLGEHAAFWVALGTILAFIPYFLYSKHLHLFFAPLNFLLKPERLSMGELDTLDFEDESIKQFGATLIEDLGWEQLMDAYACIMCFRCQEVCPAYTTGKVLSPAAMEVNKRYFLNYEGVRFAKGEPSQQPLTEYIISPEAVWACTACGACVDICPVGNEPMRDILDIRRSLVLMENQFPEQWQTAFRGMERTRNPWNIPSTERMKWAEGLDVPTIDENPEPEYLWWVGCAPSTDTRAQKTTRAFAKILNTAGINYSVLGEQETCTGDSARRAGNEYLFYEMALGNVEMLNQIAPKKIVSTCPHCLHTLKNEYPAFGGNYEVIHHTELINQLLSSGRLHFQYDAAGSAITFHDPCYLGRQNDIFTEPRLAILQTGARLVEMKRSGSKSFCCGAGGAQMWKEEEQGSEAVNANRFREAQATGADTLAVGCPFCMVMMNDAGKDASSDMQILDVAEIVAQALE